MSSPSKKAKATDTSVTSSPCPDAWRGHIGEVLFPEEVLQARVRSLAAEISDDYNKLGENTEIIVVGLLTGAICFIVDLVKHLRVPYTVDFMAVSSYRGSQSKGTVEMKKDMSFDPSGKHILIVEDIVDTGNTLMWLRTYLKSKDCASIRVVCLLDKKEGRKMENAQVIVDYVGFVCPNKFVVGYGLDYNQRYRGLPFIGVLKPEVYTSEPE
jgi:hypoxanthine phosphoribosyltransferase